MALSVFKYSNYLPSCKKSETTNDPFLRKIQNWQTNRQTDRQQQFQVGRGTKKALNKVISSDSIKQSHWNPPEKRHTKPSFTKTARSNLLQSNCIFINFAQFPHAIWLCNRFLLLKKEAHICPLPKSEE